MIDILDCSTLNWTLAGWTPDGWRLVRTMEIGADTRAEVAPVPAKVPGSVQHALLAAGKIPDWNVGINARACEWVENRHWIFSTRIPAASIPKGRRIRLRCDGLDYSGWILVNGVEAGVFNGSLTPHAFDITKYVGTNDVTLEIIFDLPPRWLGQLGYTSRISDWKPRFNYTWDWIPRLVQIGIWDDIALEFTDGDEIGPLELTTDVDVATSLGALTIRATPLGSRATTARVVLASPEGNLLDVSVDLGQLAAGASFGDIPVKLWRPNGAGERTLYRVTIEILDANGATLDSASRQVGFRKIAWEQNPGAPEGADPWLCVVNGEPLFLQGVNWTPIRPNFADVTPEQYRSLLEQYRDLGVNMLRVWGGAFLEKEIFYDICDELGLMVWQEFPLSSSGVDNMPPQDRETIDSMDAIVRSYISRRAHRASLIVWCGGNELQDACGIPLTLGHPMVARMNSLVRDLDPARRFLATSSTGPRFYAQREDMGKGLHWDVHGPWTLGEMTMDEWREYWSSDDALFRSESGAPGASSADLIRAFRGDCAETPGTLDNDLWRQTSWWIEWPLFAKEFGREPADLDEYVTWSQTRQATALELLLEIEKRRFPEIGGVLFWMGHDCFPCTANTSIIDFWGRPKPAAIAVSRIWKSKAPGSN